MSKLSDESPLFELTMDISGSCSSDSPANTSPEAHEGKIDDSFSPQSLQAKSFSDLENSNEAPRRGESTQILDNRLDKRMNSSASQLISVYSHPLMSPDPQNSNASTNTTEFFGNEPKDHQHHPVVPTQPQTPRRVIPTAHNHMQQLERDNVSTDSEDLSQYQANVGPSFQSVSLVNNKNSSSLSASKQKQSPGALVIRQESNDVSVHSFDELDGVSNFMSRSSSASLTSNILIDENPETRHDFVLADGTMRPIDMRVIEPFKRVLSHGGYLKDDCRNAIVVFSSCFLPDRSRPDYQYVMDSLFLYVLKTLEQLVTEDYVLLYLHGGSCKNNVPSFQWLKRCYQLLDRRLRKSLKNVYMVHPTFWLKSIVWMARPFISSKFWRKLVYVRNLEELYHLVPSLEQQAVPDLVKSYDVAHSHKK